jgi:site-specific DNA-methyltransferase (adenine-specific)
MKNEPLSRIEIDEALRKKVSSLCRLQRGEIWKDEKNGHRVGCLDAASREDMAHLTGADRPVLAIHDPPYNVAAFPVRAVSEFTAWCGKWIQNTARHLADDAALYVWLGADQNNGFQPFADFIIMMRSEQFTSRSFITMRNQRGYGTQKNWMSVRQELLYYTKGTPAFNVSAEYTDIPKILRGYYKEVGGKRIENIERGNSENIRAGNVWVDIQQVFYRMKENVNGCYAQKPLKAIERIINASSSPGDIVVDWFAHSGTTLLACERLNRKCFTCDIDPVFCEITIRRLEWYRACTEPGWQNSNPFAHELGIHFADAT